MSHRVYVTQQDLDRLVAALRDSDQGFEIGFCRAVIIDGDDDPMFYVGPCEIAPKDDEHALRWNPCPGRLEWTWVSISRWVYVEDRKGRYAQMGSLSVYGTLPEVSI